MKKAYFVLDTLTSEGKFYTVVCPINIESDDVISKLKSWAYPNHIVSCLLAGTKKSASEIRASWIETHKHNGNYEDEF